MATHEQRYRRQRSFFGPVVLIGAGVFLLLEQTVPDLFAVSPWWVALRLWPLLLILIGLDILLGRGSFLSTLIGTGLGLLMIVLVVALAIHPDLVPSLELAGRTLRTTAPGEIAAPRAGAQSAVAVIDAADGTLEIGPLTAESPDLFAADLAYFGTPEFTHTRDGSVEHIRLAAAHWEDPGVFFAPEEWFGGGGQQERWAIFVAPDVPFDLTVSAADAGGRLALADMNVQRLALTFADGRFDVRLPRLLRDGTFVLDDGTLDLTLPAIERSLGVRVSLSIDDDGVFNAGPALAQVTGDWQHGVWETPDFARQELQLVLDITADKGTVTIR